MTHSRLSLFDDAIDDHTTVDPPRAFVVPRFDERPTLEFRRDDYFGQTIICAVPPVPR